MACELTLGRTLSCKDAIGGLKAIYFINHGEIDPTQIIPAPSAAAPSGTITALTSTPGDVDAYKYELHLGNDLTQNINSSPENGTTYIEQVLNLTLKKLSAEDNVELLNIAYGHPTVVVEDNMGNFMIAGLLNGMDVTGGTAVTGSDVGDLNGYTITLTGKERAFANFYTGFDTDTTVI